MKTLAGYKNNEGYKHYSLSHDVPIRSDPIPFPNELLKMMCNSGYTPYFYAPHSLVARLGIITVCPRWLVNCCVSYWSGPDP